MNAYFLVHVMLFLEYALKLAVKNSQNQSAFKLQTRDVSIGENISKPISFPFHCGNVQETAFPLIFYSHYISFDGENVAFVIILRVDTLMLKLYEKMHT